MPGNESLHAPGLGVSRLLERKMRNWELARSQRPAQKAPTETQTETFICISRLVGSRGSEIAQRIADKLSWSLFDKDLIQRMAGDDKMRQHIYESMDERDLSWSETTLRSLLQHEFGRNDYFHRLSKTALGIARQGHAVFLGRGIDLVLPRDVGLRVRIVAPPEVCVQNFAKRMNLSIAKARVEMQRLEKERSEFVERHFHVRVDAATRFDLAINTASFTNEQATEIILKALALKTVTTG